MGAETTLMLPVWRFTGNLKHGKGNGLSHMAKDEELSFLDL